MTFENFQKRINQLLKRAGLMDMNVRFSHSNGRHYANFSDGTVITGNEIATKVSVKWGSGHLAHANI